jgi:biotin operon repressor
VISPAASSECGRFSPHEGAFSPRSKNARVSHDQAADVFRKAATRLVELADAVRDGERRDAVDEAVAELRAASARAFGPRPKTVRGKGAKGKILEYLQAHVGEWVYGEELAAISQIGEWARRVRELRIENGYDVEEVDGRYRLNDSAPDHAAAARWQTANAIRRRSGSARDRIVALLEASVGAVVTRDELDYVARIKEGSRRVRELRDEDGWPIESHIDDPLLRPGEYRLVSADPANRTDPRQRLYPERLRARIFKRDHYTCQECGRDRWDAERAGDSRFYLEVHHRTAVAEQLDALPPSELNNEDNLVTLCHDDHLRLTAEFQRQRRRERRGG